MNILLNYVKTRMKSLNAYAYEYRRVPFDYLSQNESEELMETLTKALKQYSNDYAAHASRPIDVGLEIANFDSVIQWRKNKQVYSFERDFMDILLETPLDFELGKDMLNTLPYNTFAVEVDDRYSIVNYLSGPGNLGALVISSIDPDNDNEAWVAVLTFNEGMTVEEMVSSHSDSMPDAENGRSRIREAVQAVLYLSAENRKVTENPKQRSTYKKPSVTSKPKDCYSEIQKWDCGFVINEYKQKKYSVETSDDVEHKSGSSKRPHWRRARWTTVWTGKGRTTPKLKWLAPSRIHPELEIPVPTKSNVRSSVEKSTSLFDTVDLMTLNNDI